ncbi:MAG: nucleotidyltransferase domain-containing protein [Candidatus Bathyarchaeia archaeon]
MEEDKGLLDLGVSQLGKDVLKAVLEYIERLKGKVNLHTVIVFGSRVRGDYEPWSDVDLVIIADDLSQGIERMRMFYSVERGAAIEPRPYTREEFLMAIEAIDITAWDSICDGVVILDDGFWKSAKEKFTEVRERYGLVRTKTGWRALDPS